MTINPQPVLEHIADDGRQAARDLIERARDRLVTRLAGGPSEYDIWFYTQMQAEADRLLADLREPLTDRLLADVGAAADAVDAALEQARRVGIEVGGVGWTRAQVEYVSRAAIGDRITTALAGGQQTITAALQQGMLGVLTPHEVRQAIAASLDENAGFGPLWYRADMIWNTEINGAANRSMIEQTRAIERRSPGKMRKRWLHSGNTRHPRVAHVQLGGLPAQPPDQMYLVNGWEAYGPHDGGLPAEEVIRCGCTLILDYAE